MSGVPGEIKITFNRNREKTETLIGSDGKASKEIHHSTHGNSSIHNNPHGHIITYEYVTLRKRQYGVRALCRERVGLPLSADIGPHPSVAASSGLDSKDLRRKFGERELRRGTDVAVAGAGAGRREGQPFHRAARYEKGRAAEASGPQAAGPDEGGRRGAKGGKSDPPELYRGGAQSKMAD